MKCTLARLVRSLCFSAHIVTFFLVRLFLIHWLYFASYSFLTLFNSPFDDFLRPKDSNYIIYFQTWKANNFKVGLSMHPRCSALANAATGPDAGIATEFKLAWTKFNPANVVLSMKLVSRKLFLKASRPLQNMKDIRNINAQIVPQPSSSGKVLKGKKCHVKSSTAGKLFCWSSSS